MKLTQQQKDFNYKVEQLKANAKKFKIWLLIMRNYKTLKHIGVLMVTYTASMHYLIKSLMMKKKETN